MQVKIKNRWTNAVMFECEVADNLSESKRLGAAVKEAVASDASLSRANLSGADLSRADLSGADLSRADLSDANLSRASLSDASLWRASLWRASLWHADLSRADLSGADLSGADLSRADLSGADLSRASLSDAKIDSSTIIETKETWGQYLSEVVPQLLTAGGKTIEEVSAAWDCHEWSNCPMAVAFGVHDEEGTPILLRPRVKQFVMYFDAKLIPCPIAKEKKTCAV